jgi:hypothetical protein
MGWIGAAAYLIGYFLLSIGKLKSDKPLYHVLNIIGAAGLITDAISLNDYPNLVVNGLWALIAVFALVLIFRKR